MTDLVHLPLNSRFMFGDWVIIDDDPSIKGRVTALLFRPSEAMPTVEVSWLHNGQATSAWIETWRLKCVQEGPPEANVVPLRKQKCDPKPAT